MAITVPENIMHILEIVPGETREDKLLNLLAENIAAKLKECDARIVEFETKYGMSFVEFEQAWAEKLLGDPFSYSLEKDYMEWEGFCLEKKKWLSLLKEVRESSQAKT
ncbi:MAG: hypothetical protein R6V59_02640 [Dehalococcoidia bacterium]